MTNWDVLLPCVMVCDHLLGMYGVLVPYRVQTEDVHCHTHKVRRHCFQGDNIGISVSFVLAGQQRGGAAAGTGTDMAPHIPCPDSVLSQKSPQQPDHRTKFCLPLGMSACSWEGWSRMHVDPLMAIRYFFFCEAVHIATCAYTVTGLRIDSSLYCFLVTVPMMLFTSCNVCTYLAFWRLGPEIVHHKLYTMSSLLTMICIIPVVLLGYMGPETMVPWNSRVHFVCVNASGTVFAEQSAAAGKSPRQHPQEPRTSLLKPIIRSAVVSLLLVDALTDLSLIRSLFERVCSTSFPSSLFCCTASITAMILKFSMTSACPAVHMGAAIMQGQHM